MKDDPYLSGGNVPVHMLYVIGSLIKPATYSIVKVLRFPSTTLKSNVQTMGVVFRYTKNNLKKGIKNATIFKVTLFCSLHPYFPIALVKHLTKHMAKRMKINPRSYRET